MQEKKDYKIFVDTETTGFPEQGGWLGNDLLTWSGIITDKDLNIIKKTTLYSRPTNNYTWSDAAEEVHGISYFEAMNFPKQRQTVINIMEFIKDFRGNIEWVEHSLNWIDWLFTFGLFYKHDLDEKFNLSFSSSYRFSTIKMARDLGYKKNKLDEWAKRLNIELVHHNSESDAMACYETYKYLVKNKNKQEGLFQFIKE